MSEEVIEAEIIKQDDAAMLTPLPQQQHMKLMEIAINKGAEIETLERLMSLHDDFEKKEARKAFFAALSEFQSCIPVIKKEGRAYNNAEYARLEDIAQSIRKELVKCGLSYRFEQAQHENMMQVSCIVSHQDGHSEKTSMSAAADKTGNKNAIQAIASTSSYLRRYTLTGALGIVVGGEDDDAEAFHDVTQSQSSTNYYPDESFEQNFPAWAHDIQAGSKTPDQVIQFLSKKGVILSPNQIDRLRKVG